MSDHNAEAGSDDGNRLITTRNDVVGKLADIAIDLAARDVAIAETTSQVVGLNEHIGSLRRSREEDRAGIEHIRTAARDEALLALQGPATLADVFTLLAVGMDRGNDVSQDRLKAVVAEAEHLATVRPGQTVIRVGQDGYVAAYTTQSGVRLGPDNTNFVIDAARSDGNVVQLTSPLRNLVKRLPDGTYAPAYSMYIGSAQIREGFGQVAKANPTDAVTWAAALQEHGNRPKWLGVRRDDIDMVLKTAMNMASDLASTTDHQAVRAIRAAFCLEERNVAYIANRLRRRIMSKLSKALAAMPTDDEDAAKRQRAELHRTISGRIKFVLDSAYKEDTTEAVVKARVDAMFSTAEPKS